MQILNRNQVLILTKMSQTTLRHLLSISDFPKPIILGGSEVGWREGDVHHWKRSIAPETWDPKD